MDPLSRCSSWKRGFLWWIPTGTRCRGRIWNDDINVLLRVEATWDDMFCICCCQEEMDLGAQQDFISLAFNSASYPIHFSGTPHTSKASGTWWLSYLISRISKPGASEVCLTGTLQGSAEMHHVQRLNSLLHLNPVCRSRSYIRSRNSLALPDHLHIFLYYNSGWILPVPLL